MDIKLRPSANWLIVAALVLVTAVLYGAALNQRPFDQQETLLASQAESLVASGGRDADGRRLPLFVHAGGDAWLAPGQAYAAAAAARIGSPSLPPVRWLTVIAGALDVVLIFVLATRMFSSTMLGALAALLLLLTPAHAQFSRSAAADGVWPLPLLMVWILGLVIFCDQSARYRRQALTAGAVALAAIAYLEPSSPLMVPVFAAVSLFILAGAGEWQRRDLIPAGIGFVITLTPLVLWFATHQSTYPETFGRWVIHLAHVRNPLEGLRAATSTLTVASVSATYWEYFNPGYLFINGNAAGFAGLFLIPAAILLVVGAWTVTRQGAGQPRSTGFLLLAGFLCAPFVAATFKEAHVTGRALVIVPFGVLLATRGFEAIQSRPGVAQRVLIAVLLVAAPFQFFVWYRDLLRLH